VLDDLRIFRKRAAKFTEEAARILAKHESSTARIISLDDTRKKLTGLSLRQHDLFKQGLDCIEYSLNRPAHVMAWAAYIDLVEDKLASDGLVKLKAIRPAWSKHAAMDDIRDNIAEYQLIEAAKDLKLVSKAAMKALHGLLSKRNECAHPSTYSPNLNETLGYVSELLNRAGDLSGKTL
jgi:hypothetical protein